MPNGAAPIFTRDIHLRVFPIRCGGSTTTPKHTNVPRQRDGAPAAPPQSATNDHTGSSGARRLPPPGRTRRNLDDGRRAPHPGKLAPSGSPRAHVPLEAWLLGRVRSGQHCSCARRFLVATCDSYRNKFKSEATCAHAPCTLVYTWGMPVHGIPVRFQHTQRAASPLLIHRSNLTNARAAGPPSRSDNGDRARLQTELKADDLNNACVSASKKQTIVCVRRERAGPFPHAVTHRRGDAPEAEAPSRAHDPSPRRRHHGALRDVAPAARPLTATTAVPGRAPWRSAHEPGTTFRTCAQGKAHQTNISPALATSTRPTLSPER